MSKSFRTVIVTVTAVVALSLPAAAQTIPDDASQQRPTEIVPACVPAMTHPV
jgi:hypothetical protein